MVDLKLLAGVAGVVLVAMLGAFISRRPPRSTPCNGTLKAPCFPLRDRPLKPVSTSATGRLSAQSAISWRWDEDCDGKPAHRGGSVAAGSVTELIKIDPRQGYQSILGFGGAMTDAAAFTFNRLDPDARAQLFHQLFHPSQLGLNVNRVCMGASDYATKVYSYCDGPEPDPELKRFSIDHDRQWILPMLREARAQNPEMFIFGSPWSPPGWMKSNGSMLGGNMQRRYMDAHAQYFVRFVQDYGKEGIPVQAVTVNNEVDTDQDGRMPACAWPQEYEVDFIRGHLGPALKAASLDTQVWMLDHNYNLWGRALASLAEPGMLEHCQGIAWHGYVGDAARVTQVHEAYPQIGMYWTEGGPDITDPNYATDWVRWGKTFTGNLRNWCRAVTAWNLALDDKGNPNIGPFPCGGLVTVDSQSNAISYSGQFWAMAQFSSFVKRGAVRIASEGDYQDLFHVAFKNPDGQCVLVVTNGSDKPREVTLNVSEQFAEVHLEPNSVTTLIW